MTINLTLDDNEVTGIIQTLDALPTSSGAWPLVQKLKAQVANQTTPPATTPEAA